MRGHGAFDVTQQYGILDLGLKERHRLFRLAVICVAIVAEQVRQHLDEMRLPGAKETGDPDANRAGDRWLMGRVIASP